MPLNNVNVGVIGVSMNEDLQFLWFMSIFIAFAVSLLTAMHLGYFAPIYFM